MPVAVAHLQVVAVAALCKVALSSVVAKRLFHMNLSTRIHPRKEMKIGDGGNVQLSYVQDDLLAVGGQDSPLAGISLVLRNMSFEVEHFCHSPILTSLNFLAGSDPGDDV